MRIEFFSSKTFAAAFLHSGPEDEEVAQGEVVELVLVAVEYEKECYAALFFKCLHEFYLVGMDVCEGEGVCGAFFGVKAYGDSLYCSNVVYGASLFEVGQGDMTVFFVHSDGGDGCWDFLDECKFFFSVLFVGAVYEVFQCGAS